MISMMIYDPQKAEQKLLEKAARQAAASLTEERWQIYAFDTLEQVADLVRGSPLLDLACYDVAPKGSIRFLEQVRTRYQETLLLLIADPSISPMDYIRPTILASALLLRPIDARRLQDSLSELLERYKERLSTGQEASLAVETREGTTYVPYSKIYYLEAREKKIYVRLKRQELTFYGTLEQLASQLPENFLRCHRSFIVCRDRIQKVMLSRGFLELEQGIQLPLSRSYKPLFKEAL